MLLPKSRNLVKTSKKFAKIQPNSDAHPINLRCLSVQTFFCNFADVEIRLLLNHTPMSKKTLQFLAEILRLLAALLAGYGGASL